MSKCALGTGFLEWGNVDSRSDLMFKVSTAAVGIFSVFFAACHTAGFLYPKKGSANLEDSVKKKLKTAAFEAIGFNTMGFMLGMAASLVLLSDYRTDATQCQCLFTLLTGMYALFNISTYRFLLAKSNLTDVFENYEGHNALVWWFLHTGMILFYGSFGIVLFFSSYGTVNIRGKSICYLDFLGGKKVGLVFLCFWTILDAVVSLGIMILLVVPALDVLTDKVRRTVNRNVIGGFLTIASTAVVCFIWTDTIHCGEHNLYVELPLKFGIIDIFCNLMCLNLMFPWSFFTEKIVWVFKMIARELKKCFKANSDKSFPYMPGRAARESKRINVAKAPKNVDSETPEYHTMETPTQEDRGVRMDSIPEAVQTSDSNLEMLATFRCHTDSKTQDHGLILDTPTFESGGDLKVAGLTPTLGLHSRCAGTTSDLKSIKKKCTKVHKINPIVELPCDP